MRIWGNLNLNILCSSGFTAVQTMLITYFCGL
jgi:hypothetical protein